MCTIAARGTPSRIFPSTRFPLQPSYNPVFPFSALLAHSLPPTADLLALGLLVGIASPVVSSSSTAMCCKTQHFVTLQIELILELGCGLHIITSCFNLFSAVNTFSFSCNMGIIIYNDTGSL